MADAYDKIDRFLRNNLDDVDYAEYSAALDEVLAAAPQQQSNIGNGHDDWARKHYDDSQQQAEPVAECKDDGEGGVYYSTLSNRAPIGLLYTSPVPRITADQVAEINRRIKLVINRLQMDIDGGSRPDQWSMQSMQRDLHAALDALVAKETT